jgi:hypothetical protein
MPLFIIILVPKCKSSDASSAYKPKRSRDVLSISEKVKILAMIAIKKLYAEIARLYGKNESSIREVMKNKEKMYAHFSVALQTAKVTAIAHDKVLMKVQNVLYFWLEYKNRKRFPLFITLYYYYLAGCTMFPHLPAPI